MHIAAGNLAPEPLSVDFQEQDAIIQPGIMTEMPSGLDRVRSLFDNIAEGVADVAEQVGDKLPTLPKPSLGRTARLVGSVLAIGGVLPGAAEATIVIGQGTDGVKIGENKAAVQKTLGKPKFKNTVPGQGMGWEYPTGLDGVVSFNTHSTVTGVSTTSPKQRTAKGIGPGSSLTAVKQAYPGAKCATGPLGPQSVECDITTNSRGKRVITSITFMDPSRAQEVDINLAN